MFDRIIAVDWSARSAPSPARPVKDAIYICNRSRNTGRQDHIAGHPTYHRTRDAAMTVVQTALDAALVTGERVFLGFDFGFGYPAGFAERLTGRAEALAVWDWLNGQIVDAPDNANNRFSVAAGINALFDGLGPFWGCCAIGRSRQRTGDDRSLASRRSCRTPSEQSSAPRAARAGWRCAGINGWRNARCRWRACARSQGWPAAPPAPGSQRTPAAHGASGQEL